MIRIWTHANAAMCNFNDLPKTSDQKYLYTLFAAKKYHNQ